MAACLIVFIEETHTIITGNVDYSFVNICYCVSTIYDNTFIISVNNIYYITKRYLDSPIQN